MTQKEKAKAYDELLIKAKQIYNKENDVLIIHTVEDLFPELAESEDERIRKALIKYFKKGCEYLNLIPYSKDECIAWLEKQDEQKSAWSEEDEEIKNFLIALVEWSKSYASSGVTVEESKTVLNWLKSLRPQNKWKPSDEQMKALEEAINEQWDVDGDALWHLYQDLKKLREE